MSVYTVLLVDDHALVRAGLKELLLTFKKYDIVGEAGDGLAAVELAQQLKPDLVVLDLAIPKLHGVEAIVEIKRVSPESKILVLSMYDRDEYVRQSIKNGADGYILKGAAIEELQAALEHLERDKMFLSPALSQSIIKDWVHTPGNETARIKSVDLTQRENGVLKLLAEGHTNRETAELLHISVKTVETHRSRIMAKLSIDNLAELVKYAIKKGLVDI